MTGLTSHWWLIVLILVVVLIIWGPGKLPDVGAGMGRAIREFRKASSETRDTFTAAVNTPEASGAQTQHDAAQQAQIQQAVDQAVQQALAAQQKAAPPAQTDQPTVAS